MARVVLALSSFLFSINIAEASSCCGGSPITFLLPQNNQKISMNIGYSQINGVGRVFQASENFIEWNKRERTLDVIGLSAAYMLEDRLSLSLQSSFFFSNYEDQFGSVSDKNWGDTTLSLNFEALPEYTFSKYKPKIFTSLLVNAPTGRSIFEDDVSPEGANVTGHGLWGLGLGVSIYKTWSPYALSLQTRAINIFSGEISNQRISNYVDFSSSLRFTRILYSKWAIVAGLDWSYISKRERSFFEVVQQNSQALSSQRTTTSLGVNYVLTESSTLSLTYLDESLLGQPRNTVINRTLTLNLNKNFN